MQADLERILFDEATIHRRLDELARISEDFNRELTVVAILNGSVIDGRPPPRIPLRSSWISQRGSFTVGKSVGN